MAHLDALEARADATMATLVLGILRALSRAALDVAAALRRAAEGVGVGGYSARSSAARAMSIIPR